MPVAFGAAQSTTFLFEPSSAQTRMAVHEALSSQALRSFAHDPASAHETHAPQLPLQ